LKHSYSKSAMSAIKAAGRVGQHGGQLPIDYELIRPIVCKGNKLIVEMHDYVLEEELHSVVVDPRTGEKKGFGYLYEWGIDVVPRLEELEDADGTVRAERMWIPLTELPRLEGYVIRFVLEGNSLGQEYVAEATYKVVDGRLVPAPEFLSTRAGF
jgi:hypothetical protein